MIRASLLVSGKNKWTFSDALSFSTINSNVKHLLVILLALPVAASKRTQSEVILRFHRHYYCNISWDHAPNYAQASCEQIRHLVPPVEGPVKPRRMKRTTLLDYMPKHLEDWNKYGGQHQQSCNMLRMMPYSQNYLPGAVFRK